jgi:hypothetical protein
VAGGGLASLVGFALQTAVPSANLCPDRESLATTPHLRNGNKIVETSDQHVTRQRLSITIVVLLAAMAHLAWELFHGGVQTHHVLQRRDLPGISNWWGLLTLPGLTWYLLGRVQRRMQSRVGLHSSPLEQSRLVFWSRAVLIGAVGGFVFGALLSTAFALRQEDLAFYVLLSIVLLAVLLPIYRAECVLGFVLAMTLVFGALLPTMIATILAAVSALLHLLVYPRVLVVWRTVTKSGSR